MDLGITARAADFLTGALTTIAEKDGWVRPSRFTPDQTRALGSCRAWHPGLYRQMAACTAGIALEFDCDASHVAIELRQDPFGRGTAAVLADVTRAGVLEPPYDGVSATVDGVRVPVFTSAGQLGGAPELVELSLDGVSAPEPGLQRLPGMGERHRVRVWLPCLTSCAVRDVTADGTFLTPVPAKDELLVLGDSLAQGFVSPVPGDAWAARLADAAGLTLVNQGVGGQVFQPGTLVGLAEATHPAAVVVEFGANYRYEPCQAARVEHEVRTYLYELAEAFPEVPTWVVTPLPHLEDVYHTHPRSCFSEVTDMICRHAAAHPQMRLVDGRTLLDEDRLLEQLCDASDHPGPLGQEVIACRLAAAMGIGGVTAATSGAAGEKDAAPGEKDVAAAGEASADRTADAPAPADSRPKPAARGRSKKARGKASRKARTSASSASGAAAAEAAGKPAAPKASADPADAADTATPSPEPPAQLRLV